MTKRWASVPAYSEVRSIAAVVASVQPYVDGVIVVDDGSHDGTDTAAREAGAIVERHPTNRGVGAAISTGLALARSRGADFIVQVDGDGQHVASSVSALLDRAEAGADLVIGSRFEEGFPMSWPRRMILRVVSHLVSRQVGVRISDVTSGFRVFNANAADRLQPDFPQKYLSDTVEVLLIAHERGLAVATVPVQMTEREYGDSSVGLVRGVGYTARMFVIVGKHLLKVPRHD